MISVCRSPSSRAFSSTGSVGSTVTIDGSGFGETKGSVSIGDASTQMSALADTASVATAKPVKTKITSWGDDQYLPHLKQGYSGRDI